MLPYPELPLHTAACKGDLITLETLLMKGCDINQTNRQKQTAILLAAMGQQYRTVEFLIDKGADINRQDETSLNPFLWGCLNNDLTLVKIMLKAGADLERLTRFGGVGITPAAEKGHLEVVKELLTTDINLNHTNFVGWTPLIEAIILNDGGKRQQEIIALLLQHGANPTMTDKYGKLPVQLAKEKGYNEIVDLLEQAMNRHL